jgi:hypothetical protein
LTTGQVTGIRPERSVIDEGIVKENSILTYRFIFQIIYPNLSLRQDVYVSQDGSTAQITGFQTGPN